MMSEREKLRAGTGADQDINSKTLVDNWDRALNNVANENVVPGVKTENHGNIPGTAKNQNLGHNSKKEGLGPNTKR